MSIYETPIASLDGKNPKLLGPVAGKAALFVNVASKCGLTPQYEGLQALHAELDDAGFTVVGFPCNQFLEQEPGTADDIAEFCSVNYGVTFPLSEKIEVNGDGRHRLYDELTRVADGEGHDGDIRWNFEKFVIDPTGAIVARFNPTVEPADPELRKAIDAALPA